MSSQNDIFNLSAPHVDITEALEHQKTTYRFYVSTELMVIFEPFLQMVNQDINLHAFYISALLGNL